MRLTIHAKPGARENSIEYLKDGSLRVWLKAAPVDGKANVELLEILADALGTKKKFLRIHSGASGRYKLVDVEMEEAVVLERLAPFKV